MFVNGLKETLNDEYNYAVTDNGAVGYETTGSKLLDLNFSVTSLRSADEDTIINKFLLAYAENKELALKWLFFARDIRGGLGERRTFRVITKYLFNNHVGDVINLLPYFAEYGRYDDLISLVDTKAKYEVIAFVNAQLHKDILDSFMGAPISLLAKWMPSVNASSKNTRRLGRIFARELKITEQEYRKMLSNLRRYLKVVEKDMSAKKWDKIDYAAVPSRANMVYKTAFMRNDLERRTEYLSKLEKGEVKINAGTLYPHEIYAKYNLHNGTDAALEGMWKALPDVSVDNSTLVVCDGSGSMSWNYITKGVTNLDVSRALSIYFAQKLKGEFANKFITFSAKPQLVSLMNNGTLLANKKIIELYNDCSNTNIEAVFDLILKTALKKDMRQEDLPRNVLIISDMQFDSLKYNYREPRLFNNIQYKYESYGYKLPRLIFWNLSSQVNTAIPLIDNDTGAVLMGGYSPNTMKMVLSGKVDPYECLVETLMSARYADIVLNK